MNIKKITSSEADYPDLLNRLASPPKQLFCQGVSLTEVMKKPRVAIIGSRSMTAYGKRTTEDLAGSLAERDIVIISGLALGVDAAAHNAALSSGGQCLAVLPSCLERIAPRTNQPLARRILESKGTLISEYSSDQQTYKQNFVARNRIMAGLADAVLITEASIKSGTMHTARFALEQGIDVLAVPGNIYNKNSEGTNNLIKSGAIAVTDVNDILTALGLNNLSYIKKPPRGSNQHQQIVIDLMIAGVSDGHKLLIDSKLSIEEFNQVLTMLEITGKICSLGANQWRLA